MDLLGTTYRAIDKVCANELFFWVLSNETRFRHYKPEIFLFNKTGLTFPHKMS